MNQANQRLRVLEEATTSKIELVSEVFHHISRIIPENQALKRISPKTTVREALAIMDKHGVSQLPVVNGDHVLGVFSYRSFARTAAASTFEDVQREKCAPGDLAVDECLEQFDFARYRDDITSAFNALEQSNGLLVGDPRMLGNIVTRIDLIKYLDQITKPFVMLSEIELVLRKMIQRAVTQEELTLFAERSLKQLYCKPKVPNGLEQVLKKIVDRTLTDEELIRFAGGALKGLGPEGKVPSCLEKMSFNDYITIISSEDNWPKFEPMFGSIRLRVVSKLGNIREIRNAVFHFKREITDQDIATLSDFRNWLIAKAQQADVLHAGGCS